MNANQLMTVGAVAFAGFALYYITRKPGGQVAAQPGQAARDSGLQQWIDQTSNMFDQMSTADYWAHVPSVGGSLLQSGGYPLTYTLP